MSVNPAARLGLLHVDLIETYRRPARLATSCIIEHMFGYPGVREQGKPERRVMRGEPTGYVPPGWPQQVRPPAAPGWIPTAMAFLYDCCPPDYRGYSVLRRHPVVLARCATFHVEGQLRASKANLVGLRDELGALVDNRGLDAAIIALQEEEAKLVRLHRAVNLVYDALRGQIFVPKL